MIKSLKTLAGLLILLCVFLPLSQCSMRTAGSVNEDTGEVLVESKVVERDIRIVNALQHHEDGIELSNILLPILFLMPLVFALSPIFNGWKRIVKVLIQTGVATVCIYSSYMLVFTIGRPLFGGWLLMFASGLFAFLSLLELIQLFNRKALILKHL